MDATSWLRQKPDSPLFPNVLWSQPQNKQARGKLLIIGGNKHAFASVAQAYEASQKAGAGTVRIVLPDALQKTLGRVLPEAQFVPSTPSGSFARKSLAELLDQASWADGVLIVGDMGRNSETAILLESFASKYSGRLILSGDSIDYFTNTADSLLQRPDTLVVADIAQLQKLLTAQVVIKQSMDLAQLVRALADLELAAAVITLQASQVVSMHAGRISSTPAQMVSLTALAAYTSTWLVQQPAQPFEAITSGVFYCINH